MATTFNYYIRTRCELLSIIVSLLFENSTIYVKQRLSVF